MTRTSPRIQIQINAWIKKKLQTHMFLWTLKINLFACCPNEMKLWNYTKWQKGKETMGPKVKDRLICQHRNGFGLVKCKRSFEPCWSSHYNVTSLVIHHGDNVRAIKTNNLWTSVGIRADCSEPCSSYHRNVTLVLVLTKN